MAYQVNRFNGTFLVSVADGTIDSTTDLRFVGKNYAGYGQVQNENFLHLLEHFAGSSQPAKPISGQLWYDTVDKKIKVYDGSKFRIVGGSVSSATAPTGLAAGEFWFDSVAQQLYTWTGAEYQLIGPENPSSLGETSITTQVVKNTDGINKNIAKLNAGGSVMAIISNESFVLSSLNPITGFNSPSVIKKGITLPDTSAYGVTSPTSGTSFWGTAETARGLVDTSGNIFSIDTLVKKASPDFTSIATSVQFGNNGISIGYPQLNLSISVEESSDIVFQNQTGDNFSFRIRSDAVKTVTEFTLDGIMPGADSQYTLGTDANRWYQVFADNIAGNLTGNVIGNVSGSLTGNVSGNLTGNVTGNVVGNVTGNLSGTASSASDASTLGGASAATSATANRIALRDASANLYANQFVGTTDKSDRILVDDSVVDPTWTSADSTHYRTAKTTKTVYSIAARDSAGNLAANIFNGTATSVSGADLAEQYLADAEYEIGTVMMVGGDKEVTATTWGKRAIGVVSGNPGIMMNQDLEGGTYIALKGRVPVRVIGAIKKGEELIATDNGCAMMAVPHSSRVFAVAMETNLNTEEKIIEAIIL